MLTDIQMPVMDGYEVAKMILLIQQTSKTYLEKSLSFARAKAKQKCPIVAVTAH